MYPRIYPPREAYWARYHPVYTHQGILGYVHPVYTHQGGILGYVHPVYTPGRHIWLGTPCIYTREAYG